MAAGSRAAVTVFPPGKRAKGCKSCLDLSARLVKANTPRCESHTVAAYIHIFHDQLCADRHNADGNGFNTSPAYAASYVARILFCVFP